MGKQNVLAVLAGAETSTHVLDAAVDYAAREGASLVVVHVMSNDMYRDRQASRAAIPGRNYDIGTYSYDQATENAQSVAERAAQAAIGDRDIPYTAVGRVGDLVATVLAVSVTYDCHTIFLQDTYPGWRRMLADPTRRLAKQFDGTVVRVPRPFPENLKTTRHPPEI